MLDALEPPAGLSAIQGIYNELATYPALQLRLYQHLLRFAASYKVVDADVSGTVREARGSPPLVDESTTVSSFPFLCHNATIERDSQTPSSTSQRRSPIPSDATPRPDAGTRAPSSGDNQSEQAHPLHPNTTKRSFDAGPATSPIQVAKRKRSAAGPEALEQLNNVSIEAQTGLQHADTLCPYDIDHVFAVIGLEPSQESVTHIGPESGADDFGLAEKFVAALPTLP